MNVHQSLQILGVPAAAGLDEAKWAYKRLAIRYHPDKSREANAAWRPVPSFTPGQ